MIKNCFAYFTRIMFLRNSFLQYIRTTASEFMRSIDFNNGTENLPVSCRILRSIYFATLDKKHHQIKIVTFISSLLSSRFKLELLKFM